jgi:hypothetical protein
MGCNDFRSTKRGIYWAAISYPSGPGVLINSDGAQHVRANVETDRVSVHVNDWYGGQSSGLLHWGNNYGDGKLISKGDTIESTLRLRFVRFRPTDASLTPTATARRR